MFNLLTCFLLMINPILLAEKLTGLVGFRQPYNPDYQLVSIPNQASRSGYLITDNPFVKIETIKDCQDYPEIAEADFNKFLREKVQTSIVNVINAVFNENDFIDRQLIYKDAANKFSVVNTVNTYDLTPGFNAYWLKPSSEKDLAFKINRVFLEFDGTGELKLYLFNTGNLREPLKTKTVTINKPLVEVSLDDWTCDNAAAGLGYKGDYYFGYFSDGLSLKPFRRDYREAAIMQSISEIFVQRVNFASFTTPAEIFDLNTMTPYNPYNGLNPDITVYEDFTDFVIQNEKLFARAIQLDAQISFLTECVASIQSNRNERISGMNVSRMMIEIEGETGENNVKVKGLRSQFYGALAQARKEVQKLQKGLTGKYQIRANTLT